MQNFKLNRETAHLAVLQRTELIGRNLKKLRKLFGRYLFTVFFSKYFINPNKISKNYYDLMEKEFFLIKKYLKKEDRVLSIGSGIGGLEVLISKTFDTNTFFIEKNYISKKIKYGWDSKNQEAYNNLSLLADFLLNNGVNQKKFSLFDFDKNDLPNIKFDVIISLYSLDYHYEFSLYKDYLKKIVKPESVLIFDTIRPEYFNGIFKNVEIIKQDLNTVHQSKRIVCRNF